MIADSISPLGFEIVEAINGLDAVKKAESERPDLILMDLVMPAMDGLEAMRRLRRLPGLKEVPIIAVSASATDGDQTSSLKAGANVFLPKPVNLELLLNEIGVLLKLTWIEGRPAVLLPPEPQAVEELVIPPAEEMKTLLYLARMGNMAEILRWARYVSGLDERYRPFADQLSQLARHYRSKAILKLVEQHMDKVC